MIIFVQEAKLLRLYKIHHEINMYTYTISHILLHIRTKVIDTKVYL